jgi:hypothetical protein
MEAQLAEPLPGYRLWGVLVEVRVRGVHLCSKFICILEEARAFPAGRLLVLVRHVLLQWEDLAPLPGLPRSLWQSGQHARDIALEQILAGNARAGLGLPDPRQR